MTEICPLQEGLANEKTSPKHPSPIFSNDLRHLKLFVKQKAQFN